MAIHQKPVAQTTGPWLSEPRSAPAQERNLTTHLCSCSWQEVLNNDRFAQGWERSFHDAPHEGLHQRRGDASALLHLVQDLQGQKGSSAAPGSGLRAVALLLVKGPPWELGTVGTPCCPPCHLCCYPDSLPSVVAPSAVWLCSPPIKGVKCNSLPLLTLGLAM